MVRERNRGWPHHAVKVRFHNQGVVVVEVWLTQHHLLVRFEDRVRLVVSNVPDFWDPCNLLLSLFFGERLRTAQRTALDGVFERRMVHLDLFLVRTRSAALVERRLGCFCRHDSAYPLNLYSHHS